MDWRDESEYRWLLCVETEEQVYVSIEDAVETVILESAFPDKQIS